MNKFNYLCERDYKKRIKKLNQILNLSSEKDEEATFFVLKSKIINYYQKSLGENKLKIQQELDELEFAEKAFVNATNDNSYQYIVFSISLFLSFILVMIDKLLNNNINSYLIILIYLTVLSIYCIYKILVYNSNSLISEVYGLCKIVLLEMLNENKSNESKDKIDIYDNKKNNETLKLILKNTEKIKSTLKKC